MSTDLIQTPAQEKTYPSRFRLIFTLLGLLFIVPFLTGINSARLVTNHSASVRMQVDLLVAFTALLMLAGFFWIFIAWQVRIVTSSNGIVYHAGYYTLRADWNGVEGIREISLNSWSASSIRCLILRDPAITGWMGVRTWGGLPMELRKKAIPLTSAWVNLDDLVHEIHQRAPQTDG